MRNLVKVFNIEFYYLLFYSLNLNLIEWFWKVMNEYVRNNIYFFFKLEFILIIKEFFDVMLLEVVGLLVFRIMDNF